MQSNITKITFWLLKNEQLTKFPVETTMHHKYRQIKDSDMVEGSDQLQKPALQ